MPRNLFSILILLLSLPLLAQKEGRANYLIPKEYGQIHKKGEEALLKKKYGEALRYFKRVLKTFPKFPPALRSAGACQELMGNFSEASDYYLQTIQADPFFSRALYFECGKSLYQSGKYREALAVFEQFDSLKQLKPTAFEYNGIEEQAVEERYYAKLNSSLRACYVAIDSIQFWNIPQVFNLGNAINSGADEYFPFLSNDGNTIYYTRRKNDQADEDLYYSTRPQGQWRGGDRVPEFNTDENEGMASLVRDGRKMFFTACQRPDVLGPCDIWEGKMDGFQVVEERPVSGLANSEFWESQASVSCDGGLLFFSSNREGGFGGADIWISRRMEGNRWSEPENPGSNINTSDDEEAPFISNDGRVLYFSSTGHLGFGEQDIFMSRMQEDGSWGYAVNLGTPVNSAYRELGFYLSADGQTGYFASNRKEGYGGMDIYYFQLPEQLTGDPIAYVEGWVKDSITQLPVQTEVYFKNRPPAQTDEQGRFFLCVKANDTLEIRIRAEDYHAYQNRFAVPLWENRAFYNLNILLDPLFHLPAYTKDLPVPKSPPALSPGQATELRHSILFNFDESELKPEEVSNLSDFLKTAFSGKPVLSVDIVGYADDIGTDAYNLQLSEKRAKNVGIQLKERDIQVDKIYIEGKGKITNGPQWQNRRVDVVIYLER